ncbi:MAG TPA: imidazole glycerol phosphate synthase subunit HisH [Gammaproteobacteria bacterium]|nr:imidazole glycerol phosphate synthase subunit HisH [Gammaproteobacteria bacterium]
MNVVIIDYGMGNIKSLIGALNYIGIHNVVVSSEYEKLKNADRLILPGVGSFAKAIKVIKEKNLDVHLQEFVVEQKKSVLGICLGMQLMSMSSTEQGENVGLCFVKGEVTRFNDKNITVPHVGFDQVAVNNKLKLYQDMNGYIDFYFTHSFRLNSSDNINQCMCHYGEEFVASYELDNIAGVQFHPELSQNNGLKLIKNFIEKF